MRTELRFLLAIVLMVGVLVGTNLLFPPAPPEEGAPDGVDTVQVVDTPEAEAPVDGPDAAPEADTPTTPEIPQAAREQEEEEDEEVPAPTDVEAEGREVVVESPLYRYAFSTRGARVVSAQLSEFESFTRDGPVELIPDGAAAFGNRIVVDADTLDLRTAPFEVEPSGGLDLSGGGEAGELAFTYQHPTAPFEFRIVYTFRPDSYVTEVRGEVSGLGGGVLYTDLGPGLGFNEQQREDEIQSMAYVGNHLQDGITAWNLNDLEEPTAVRDGPFLWTAFKSKYFVLALLPGEEGADQTHIGGILHRELEEPARADVTVTQPVGSDNAFAYRLFMGPQDFARLTAIGDDLEDVNPYGWRFFRPVIRPLVGLVMSALTFLHGTLGWGYGWVLILFGVMMRVLLFPLNQKAMRAQLRNMAVQPLLKEVQEKYKDQPEKLQKEMMKLYKEHGFNPVAGCLPMLLPWPVLITLFFVFQNTIELRGVPFLWLPDLSSPDPLYILPSVLGVSMFLLQFISYRSMEEPNPQMKMMMWIMPAVMVFIFLRFASGLNLYYATANIATLPQQFWIAKERRKAQKHGPPSRDE